MSSARCHSFRGYCPPRRRPRWSWRSTPTGQRRSPWEDIVVRSRRDASPASLDVLDLALDGVETSRQLLELGAESLRELAHGLFQLGRAGGELLAGGRNPSYASRVLDGHVLIDPAELSRLHHELTCRGQIVSEGAHVDHRLVRILLGHGHRLAELALHETQLLVETPELGLKRGPSHLLLLQVAQGDRLGSLGYVRSVDEGHDLRHRCGTALAVRRGGVPRPRIDRAVARQNHQAALLGIEEGQGAHVPGLFYRGLNGVAVSRKGLLSVPDGLRLRRRHQRLARATDHHLPEEAGQENT